MAIETINPTTGEALARYEEMSPTVAGRVITEVDAARLGFTDRDIKLRAVAAELRRRKEELARRMALEMGKPVTQGLAEVEKCAWVCEYFAEHAATFLADEPVKTEAAKSFVCYEPLGVLLAVMPWNFPFWQVFRCAAPAWMAGNGIVLKHASNVTGCALAIEQICAAAGTPLRTVVLRGTAVGELIPHPLVRAVTLTGSVPAGCEIAAAAGRALKKTVLELGGSDPYVVLADADLELAAKQCAASRLINSGQSCIAAKRFIVEEAVREQFTDLFIARLRAARVGEPLAAETTVGPLARADLREELHALVQHSVTAGARLLLGGQMPAGKGCYYPVTALDGVRPGMPVFDEETFGPVAAIVAAKDEADAVRLANQSVFGLGAAVFTGDRQRGERVARQLAAGCCAVNDFVKSDPRLPFGGIKDSGYGRELGCIGIREFVNIKSVVVA